MKNVNRRSALYEAFLADLSILIDSKDKIEKSMPYEGRADKVACSC